MRVTRLIEDLATRCFRVSDVFICTCINSEGLDSVCANQISWHVCIYMYACACEYKHMCIYVCVWVCERVRPSGGLWQFKDCFDVEMPLAPPPCGSSQDPADITTVRLPSSPLPPLPTSSSFFNHSIQTWQRVPSVFPLPTLTPFHPPGNSSAAVSTLGLLGECYGFEVHMQGWTLVCMRCWVIVEAKCLIAHDRQSSGELRRTRLQNHNQALSHPKHQRGVGIILSGDVCPNKVFTLVKHICVAVMLGNFFFPQWNIQQ